MSGAFITALGLDPKTAASPEGYVCTCGLRLGISVDKPSAGNALLYRPAVLAGAHKRHHMLHFGIAATLYMQGEPTPPGSNGVVKAFCSCDYDAEVARA